MFVEDALMSFNSFIVMFVCLQSAYGVPLLGSCELLPSVECGAVEEHLFQHPSELLQHPTRRTYKSVCVCVYVVRNKLYTS